jgi:signal transduction histidine kinase
MTSRPITNMALYYQGAIGLLFAFGPAVAVAYLQLFSNSAELLIGYHFHEVAITVAVSISLFLSYLAYRCYLQSGETLTRYLALAYFGFAVIYAPHGALTCLAGTQPALFLLWGPASRLVMGGLLAWGLVTEGRCSLTRNLWAPALAFIAFAFVLVGWLAAAHAEWFGFLRQAIEASAAVVCLGSLILLLVRRARGPLLWYFGTAQLWFVIASVAFLLAKPWNAQWWLAHAISAAGFLLLGSGVAHVLRTCGSFSAFYSPEAMFTLLTDAERMWQELRQAKEAADQSTRTKLAFFAAANHDLRQPAQSLSLFIEVLRSRLQAGRPVDAVLDQLDHANTALQHILNELLDVSKIDAGMVAPEMGNFPLDDLLAELVEECRVRVGNKPLDIVVEAHGCHLWSDRQILRRVLGNLLDNAIKFTEAGHIIIAGRQQAGGGVRVSVQDSGPGIPPEKQAMIFEEFVQVTNGARDRNQGLGLGLAVVQRLTGLLGGAAGVSSIEGKGSCFWIDLPTG